MASPEVEAAARAEAIKDVPPVAAPKGAARRGPGRPKATSAPNGAGPASAPPGARGPGRPPGAAKPKLAPKLEELIAVAGLFVAGTALARGDDRLAYDGERIMAGAGRLALALDKAAQESPALRRTLEMLVATSTWGELLTATAAIVLPILANHGALPELAATVAGAPAPPARTPGPEASDTPAGTAAGDWFTPPMAEDDARKPAHAGNGAPGWPPVGRIPLDIMQAVTELGDTE